jgi:DNA replication and repair protein RecF
MTIAKLYPPYLGFLKNFRQSLIQRNSLLKTDFSASEKEAWDHTFSQNAKSVVEYRNRFFNDFSEIFRQTYSNLINDNEKVNIVYKPSIWDETDFEQKMLRYFHDNINREKKYQETLIGPHRDDFYITLNGVDALHSASQGQKRSIVIALKLSIASLIFDVTGICPILIFDDTLAELDIDRTSSLLSHLTQKHQIFVATPEKNKYLISRLPVIEL